MYICETRTQKHTPYHCSCWYGTERYHDPTIKITKIEKTIPIGSSGTDFCTNN